MSETTRAPRRDASGALVVLPASPTRIVSLVPSLTELCFDLGLEDRMAGATIFCTEPRDRVSRLPRVGREKDPDLGRIRSLAPDLVLANVEENRREVVEALRAEGVAVWVVYPRSVAEGIVLVRELGEMTGAGSTGAALAARLEARLAQVVARTAARPRARVFCPIWRNPYMTVARDTYVHDMLSVCGGDNVFGHRSTRYPTVTLEEVAAARPEVVLLPDEPYRFRPVHLADLEPLAETPALRAGRVHFVDGKLLSWYGTRIGAALERLPVLLAS